MYIDFNNIQYSMLILIHNTIHFRYSDTLDRRCYQSKLKVITDIENALS